uniref:Uncharacterized protein n=1 Tax=Myoviridae sp. ctPuP5 TaxID=2823543 RepID=A0A8S5L9M9_9CAUD|nr:MAG TPA: hypothetical protein [Myoviridae sp. ctPuP5]
MDNGAILNRETCCYKSCGSLGFVAPQERLTSGVE